MLYFLCYQLDASGPLKKGETKEAEKKMKKEKTRHGNIKTKKKRKVEKVGKRRASGQSYV